MIRALLYRLLIISAHLQRHGIRLLIAIGRFNARAAAFAVCPNLSPAPFDSEPSTLPPPSPPFVSPFLSSPLFFLLSLSLRSLRGPRWTTHRCPSLENPLQLSWNRGQGANDSLPRKFRDDSRKRGRRRRISGGIERKKRDLEEVVRSREKRPARGKIGDGGGSDSRNESEIAARLIKSELHSTGVYTPTAVRWGSTSITVQHHR